MPASATVASGILQDPELLQVVRAMAPAGVDEVARKEGSGAFEGAAGVRHDSATLAGRIDRERRSFSFSERR